MAHLAHGYIDVLTLFLALTVLMSFAQNGDGAVTEAWVQRYNNVVSNSFDRALEIVVDNAGDIIVGGGTGATGVDMLIIKYSAVDGSMIWQRHHDGPGRFFDVVALAVTTNGDVVATGYALNAGRREQYVAKYAGLNGALQWDRRHVAWTNTANALTADVVVDKAGNVVATGGYYIPSGADDAHITKYANDGSVLWQKQGITNRVLAVEVDSNDNVVITGSRNGKYYTAKYGVLDGALVWENLQEGGAHVAVDQHGDVIVAGTHATRNDGISHDYYTAKLSGIDGDLIWQKSYNGPGDHSDILEAAALDSTGNVVVTGISYESTGLSSSYTAKYAATDGALLWDQRHESVGASVAISGTNVIVLGPSTMINYASDNGAVIWDATMFGGLALAMDVRGDALAITGTAGGQGYERMNAYTARFAVADGALVWEQSYNGSANGTDNARAVALDPLGNVIVTGGSAGTDGQSDYYTAKYAKSNGALLWDNRGVRGEACCLAVDRGGNAVVFGFDGTVKHAAGDGQILWYKSRPAGDYFVPVAVNVDSSNNVVVTGWTVQDTEQGAESDLYTAKYAAADGALLWERRYASPDRFPDRPTALAVDRSDNVIIAGTSGGCYTVKYRAADGAVLWEKRNTNVSANAIALDRAGNVAITGRRGVVSSDYYSAKFAAENGHCYGRISMTSGVRTARPKRLPSTRMRTSS